MEWEIGVVSEQDRQSGVTAIGAACYFGGGTELGDVQILLVLLDFIA